MLFSPAHMLYSPTHMICSPTHVILTNTHVILTNTFIFYFLIVGTTYLYCFIAKMYGTLIINNKYKACILTNTRYTHQPMLYSPTHVILANMYAILTNTCHNHQHMLYSPTRIICSLTHVQCP